MCAITAAAAATASLAISAVSTVASVGMGIMSANQQAAQAQASLNMQAQQQRQNQEMQRQQMLQGQQQQLQSQIFQQQQNQQQMAQAQQQAADSRNLQLAQANAQIANQYSQQRQQVAAEREQIMAKYSADRLGYQRDTESAALQKRYNNEAANEVYKQEQVKITEAKKKAAFAAQTALAKSIGAKGSILSAGRTGQSVGLLVNDAERQSGFEQAQANSSMESQVQMAQIGMDQAFLQNTSANQVADNKVGFNPEAPYMPSMPGIPNYVEPFAQQA